MGWNAYSTARNRISYAFGQIQPMMTKSYVNFAKKYICPTAESLVIAVDETLYRYQSHAKESASVNRIPNLGDLVNTCESSEFEDDAVKNAPIWHFPTKPARNGLLEYPAAIKVMGVDKHGNLGNQNTGNPFILTWSPAIQTAAYQYAERANGVDYVCTTKPAGHYKKLLELLRAEDYLDGAVVVADAAFLTTETQEYVRGTFDEQGNLIRTPVAIISSCSVNYHSSDWAYLDSKVGIDQSVHAAKDGFTLCSHRATQQKWWRLVTNLADNTPLPELPSDAILPDEVRTGVNNFIGRLTQELEVIKTALSTVDNKKTVDWSQFTPPLATLFELYLPKTDLKDHYDVLGKAMNAFNGALWKTFTSKHMGGSCKCRPNFHPLLLLPRFKPEETRTYQTNHRLI